MSVPMMYQSIKLRNRAMREAKAASDFPCCQVGAFPGMDKLQKQSFSEKIGRFTLRHLRSEPVHPSHR